MSDEEAEKYQGKMHFVVHSPDFRLTDRFFVSFYDLIHQLHMLIVIFHHTVLDQLISKLDRQLQKSSAVSNEYVAAERVSGSPMDGGIPKTFVRWAITEDIHHQSLDLSHLSFPPRKRWRRLKMTRVLMMTWIWKVCYREKPGGTKFSSIW